jgi:hypothetical protein
MGTQCGELTLLGPDGLAAAFEELRASSAGLFRWFVYGRSRKGEELWGVEAGEGNLVLLAYAFPQPDEPLGGVVLLEFARRLTEEPRRAVGVRWVLLPCVDPDGARENEGWFLRPLDLGAYARAHFRPAEGEQVEWAFFVEEPGWRWKEVLPETRALAACIADLRPVLLVSWHNVLIGGAYVLLRGWVEGLAPGLRRVWEDRGLPTHRGLPEISFAEELGPGVFRLPLLGEIGSALGGEGIDDPAAFLGCGAPAYEFALRRGVEGAVVPELPLFVPAGVGDEGNSGFTLRELLYIQWREDREAFARWVELYEGARGLLTAQDARVRALEAYRRFQEVQLASRRAWLQQEGWDRGARVAEVVDALHVASYERVLPFGALWQALEEVRWPQGEALREAVEAELEQRLSVALSALRAWPVGREVLEAGVELMCVLGDAVRGRFDKTRGLW